jgi:hypothetical protein
MCDVIFDFAYVGHKFQKDNFPAQKNINLKNLRLSQHALIGKGL